MQVEIEMGRSESLYPCIFVIDKYHLNIDDKVLLKLNLQEQYHVELALVTERHMFESSNLTYIPMKQI